MRDRIDLPISDEPTRGWVDDELGLILNPGAARRAAGHERTTRASVGSATAGAAAPAPPRAESQKQRA